MAQYNPEKNDGKVYNVYTKTRSFISIWLGAIITVLSIAIIFIVASVEGVKEVKASNSDSGKILNIFREANPDKLYPEEKVDIVNYKNHDYYFVVDEFSEDKEVLKWHFAYDGGIDYIFSDYKFYVLTFIAIIVSVYVAHINYSTTVKNVKEKNEFEATLKYYQDNKKKNENYTQYIPNFCFYKNKQAHETRKREIVESFDINYEYFISDDFDATKLEEWQKKVFKKIKKIKVKRLRASDLLQEGTRVSRRISFLPEGETEHQRKFLIVGSIQKIFTNALGGLTIGFGFAFGNLTVGMVYAGMLLLTTGTSIISATEYVNTKLRNRFIGKGDLLNEFYNIKDKFIQESEAKNHESEHDEHNGQ